MIRIQDNKTKIVKDAKETILNEDSGYVYHNHYTIEIGGRRFRLETRLHYD